MPPVRKWPSPFAKAMFRALLVGDVLFIWFFHVAPHELQYTTRGLTGYGGAVLFLCSLLAFKADWRYATLGLLVSSLSIFFGMLPPLAY